MIDQSRINAERSVFALNRVPASIYRFEGIGTGHPRLLMAARTNRHNIYTLQIDLDEFPFSVPKVFVRRMLLTRDGKPMNGASAAMHTLTSEHGWTRICHYGWDSWNPGVTLYKIYVKCRLWLEAYEGHIATGRPLDHWLNHQA